jgi:hypothetical protein
MNDTPNDRNDNRIDSNNINNIVRIDSNDSIDNDNKLNSLTLTKEEILAGDLAEGLDDKLNFAFYLSVSRKYPEEFLRKTFSHVRGVPSSKIKKSKGALFNYLVQKYERREKDNRS